MAGPIPDTWAVDPGDAGARELAAGVWRLRLPWSWVGVDHVNAYLLTDGSSHMLADCGPGGDPSCLTALEHALRPTGVTLDELDHVVLTHAHSDHVGQIGEIVRRSGAEVWLHPDTAHVDAIMEQPARFSALRVRRARAEGVPERELAWFADVREETDAIIEPVRADHDLVEGVVVPSPLGPLEVVFTPGHAPSHVALVQAERGLVILGDTVCSVFAPWYDYGFTADPVGELLGSLDRFSELGAMALALPGHGRPLADLQAVVGEHRHGIAASLSAVRTAIADGPAGAYEIARRAFGPDPGAFTTFARTNLAASYLRHLRLRGEVTRATGSDGRLSYELAGAG